MAASALICWYFEKSYSVQSLNTIVEPKKKYGEFFKDGDIVKAKFQGMCYPALLVKIDGDREALIAEGKKLERLLSEHSGDILPEEIMMEIKKIDVMPIFGPAAVPTPVAVHTSFPAPISVDPIPAAVTNLPGLVVAPDVRGTSNQEQLREAPNANSPNYMRGLSPVKSRDKRIRVLEGEVKELKSDMRSTKKKLQRLEEKFEEMVSSSQSNLSTSTSSVVNSVHASVSDASNLLASVSHLSCSSEKETQEIVKRLTLIVFTKTELVDYSRTGKKSAKCQDSMMPRPALDSKKMLLLERAVLEKCPELTRTSFFRKFENLQKMERRFHKNK